MSKSYCRKCGTPLDKNQTVCDNCHTPVSLSQQPDTNDTPATTGTINTSNSFNTGNAQALAYKEPSDSSEQPFVSPSENVADQDLTEPRSENEPSPELDSSNLSEQKQKRGLSKKTVLSIIIILLVITAACGWLFRTRFAVAVSGPANYYFMKEGNLLSQTGSNLFTQQEKYINQRIKSDADLSLSVSSQNLDPSLISALNSLSIKVSSASDPPNKRSESRLALYSENNKLFSILTQISDDKVGISFPEITKNKQIVSEGMNLINALYSKDAKLYGLSRDEIFKMFSGYAQKVLLPALQKCDTETSTFIYNKSLCTKTSFKLNKAAIESFCTEFIDRISSDEDTYTFIKGITKELGDYNLSKEEYDLFVSSLSQAFQEYKNVEFDSYPVYTVIYNSSGEIISRELNYNSQRITLNTSRKNGSFIQNLLVVSKEHSINLALENKFTYDKGLLKGILAVNSNDITVAKCSYMYNSQSKTNNLFTPELGVDLTFYPESAQTISVSISLSGNGADSQTFSASAEFTYMGNKMLSVELNGDVKYSDSPVFFGSGVAKKSTLNSQETYQKIMEFVQKQLYLSGITFLSE